MTGKASCATVYKLIWDARSIWKCCATPKRTQAIGNEQRAIRNALTRLAASEMGPARKIAWRRVSAGVITGAGGW